MEQDRKSSDKPTDLWAPYFDKRGKNMQWRKYSLFNKCCWENWTATCKRMESEHSLRLQAKIHSEWIRPQCKPGYYKTPTRKQAEHTLT